MKHLLILLSLISFISCDKISDGPSTEFVSDIDGNKYEIISLGNQTWFKENLRTEHYADGTEIPHIITGLKWIKLKSGARCIIVNKDEYQEIYGYLYNWYSLVDTCGLCPTGWHVPNTEDWDELIDFLGGDELAGGKMKAVDTSLWSIPNVGATNESGFSILPGGYRNQSSGYCGLTRRGSFWSTSIYNETCAEVMITESRWAKARIDFATFDHGYYVRCIKD